jgi:N-acetylglucosaminyl-diphospho-decaprenol L-rhamnosyltransferase
MKYQKPIVSIIIVFYIGKKDIFDCIKSIKLSKPKVTYEIIVVDNGKDNQFKYLLNKMFHDVIYFKSPFNVGYGNGFNFGASIAKGKYLLSLNPDTEVFQDSIDKLVYFLNNHKETAVVSPNLVDEKNKIYQNLGTRELTPLKGIFVFSFISKIFRSNKISNNYWIKSNYIKKLKEVDTFPGYAFIIKKHVFNEVGKFDKNIFLYFEEQDIGKRIKDKGYKIFIDTEIKVKHKRSGRVNDKKLEYYFKKSRYYYFKKHFGLINAFIAESIIRIDPYLFILLLFNLIFFLKPILGHLYFAPVDILQRLKSFSIENNYIVKNSLLSDPISQFIPWFKYIGESFRNFTLPLWNPFNAGGVPFMANMQSALFFPLSYFYYFLDIRYALILAPLSKLFLIGLFTYLYLQELGISKKSSILGALAYNFAGFNITWLLWPQTNSVILLPLILLLIERLISTAEVSKYNFLWLTLSYLLLILSGHPETATQISIISGIYFLFRIFTKRNLKVKGVLIFRIYLLTIILSIGLSLFITLPFLEYIKNSFAYYQRSIGENSNFLPIKTLIFNIFPNLLGNPAKPYYKQIQGTNYQEYTGAYVGLIILISSIISSIKLFKKNKTVLFYTLSIIILLPIIYYIEPISMIFKPFNNIFANQRLLYFIAFAMCVNASFIFDELFKDKLELKLSKRLITFTIITLFAGNFIIHNYSYRFLTNYNFAKASSFVLYIKSQFNLILITSFIAYIIFNLKVIRSIYFKILALSVIIFMQTGFINIDYNPSIENKYFYPESKEISYLKNQEWSKTLEVGGNLLIMPDTNIWYGFRSILSYDAIDIKNYRTLFNRLFKPDYKTKNIYTFDKNYLDLFGVKYILSDLNINNKIVTNQISIDKYFKELIPGEEIKGSFVADENGLSSIRLLAATFNRINNCSFFFELKENTDNNIIYNKEYKCSDLYDNAFFNFDFSQINNSKNKKYMVKIYSNNSSGGNAISFWSDKDNNLVLVSLYENNMNNYPKVFEDRFSIFENPTSYNEFYFANRAISYDNQDYIIKDIEDKKYDLSRYVLLVNTLAKNFSSNNLSQNKVEVIKRGNNYIETKVISSGGYLVSTNAYYPGWKVYIDGKKEDIIKANYAFMAVMVPAGEHTIEFKYIPETFLIGLGISSLTLILLFILFIRWNDK